MNPELQKVKVTGGKEYYSGMGDYTLELYDGDEMLMSVDFNPSFVTTDHPPRILNVTYDSIKLPYGYRGDMLILYRLLSSSQTNRVVSSKC